MSRNIPKSEWGPGPWQDEPDRAEWRHAGLPCLAVRVMHHGSWCGYVAVPPGHPAYGKPYDDVEVEVHGGLTYAAACRGEICHKAAPGEPDNVWWFGFDTGHAGDYSPSVSALVRTLPGAAAKGWGERYDHARALAADDWRVDVYRTLDYVREQTERLADQLVAMTLSEVKPDPEQKPVLDKA